MPTYAHTFVAARIEYALQYFQGRDVFSCDPPSMIEGCGEATEEAVVFNGQKEAHCLETARCSDAPHADGMNTQRGACSAERALQVHPRHCKASRALDAAGGLRPLRSVRVAVEATCSTLEWRERLHRVDSYPEGLAATSTSRRPSLRTQAPAETPCRRRDMQCRSRTYMEPPLIDPTSPLLRPRRQRMSFG